MADERDTKTELTQRQALRCLLWRLLQVLVPVLILWVFVYGVWIRFPYLKPGAQVIYDTKMRALHERQVLPREAPLRVVMVGNSRTLAGFMPEAFDTHVGQGCRSYNLGLPGRQEYMRELTAMIRRGDVPTHILLQLPWPAARERPSWRDQLRRDHEWIQTLFPFRDLPRDLAIFLILSRSRGGMAAYYRRKQDIAEGMLADRGWYFIEGQSRYPGNRLPANLTFEVDTPNIPHIRRVEIEAYAFADLRQLVKRHRMQVVLVPDYYRRHRYAAPPSRNQTVAAALEPYPRFHLRGPDYVRYPNRCFSDSVHLNRDGAERYTADLAELFRQFLDETATVGKGN